MIKAVLMDVDNTILDFDAYVKTAMREGFEKFGLKKYEDYMYSVFLSINTEMWHGIEQDTLSYEELLKTRWNRIFGALGISFDGCVFEKYFKGSLFESAIPIEGAFELLAYLKEKYILCVASNGAYAQQINRLTKCGMIGSFDGLFISEKVGASKPAGEFFDYCMEGINNIGKVRGMNTIMPNQIMMVGDSLSSDIKGASAYGMKTCYFDKNNKGCGNSTAIDHAVTSLLEIKRFI